MGLLVTGDGVVVDPAPGGGRLPPLDGPHSWIGTFTGIAGIMVVALPVAALAIWALAHRRRLSGAAPGWAWRASLAEVGVVYWTAPLVWMTMLPGSGAGVVPGRVSLVPLRDLATMPVGQIVGNLLLFAAVGSLAPMRFAVLASVPRILALAAAGSTAIEVAQYVL